MKKEPAEGMCLYAVLLGDEVFISVSRQLLLTVIREIYKISPEKQITGQVVEIKEDGLYLEFMFGCSLIRMEVPKERISWV